MSDVEAAYHVDHAYGEADMLARKILRDGTRLHINHYRWRGNYYWVVAGRVLTREEAVTYEAARKREGVLT